MLSVRFTAGGGGGSIGGDGGGSSGGTTHGRTVESAMSTAAACVPLIALDRGGDVGRGDGANGRLRRGADEQPRRGT